MKRYIIGVDSQFVYHAFGGARVPRVEFPYAKLRMLIEGDGDEVVEMYSTVIRQLPRSSAAEDVAKATEDFQRVRRAYERQGVSVIECPVKQAGDSIKQSDDQRLMIRLALTCTRLKPDFLVLVAADGDYAPLVWGLREEGIRTKLIASPENLSHDLRDASYSVSDLFKVVERATALQDDRGY